MFSLIKNLSPVDVSVAFSFSSLWILETSFLSFSIAFSASFILPIFTSFIDLVGSTNTFNLTKTGYGSSSSDGGYFYLDLTGDSNSLSVTQSSTLAADWLMVTGNASNSNICIVQDDNGLATSC